MEAVKPELQLVCDFVNTLEVEDGKRRACGCGRTRSVAAGARALGRVVPTRPTPARRATLREALRDLMWANNGGEADTAAASATLDAAAQRAGVVARFDTGAIRLVAPAGGVGAVIAAAGEAMADGSWQRLKACRSDSCRWAFIDSARNRSRQWCSMSICGNREKARAFRRRRSDAA